MGLLKLEQLIVVDYFNSTTNLSFVFSPSSFANSWVS
eukprot:UN07390